MVPPKIDFEAQKIPNYVGLFLLSVDSLERNDHMGLISDQN